MATAIQVTAEINDEDMTLLCALVRFEAYNSRSPQRWEVVDAARHQRLQSTRVYDRRFDRLKALGVIEHARNGHCRLSDAGLAALAVVGQESSRV